jgi:hypothetical protein
LLNVTHCTSRPRLTPSSSTLPRPRRPRIPAAAATHATVGTLDARYPLTSRHRACHRESVGHVP